MLCVAGGELQTHVHLECLKLRSAGDKDRTSKQSRRILVFIAAFMLPFTGSVFIVQSLIIIGNLRQPRKALLFPHGARVGWCPLCAMCNKST
jgi:hypothetical protein